MLVVITMPFPVVYFVPQYISAIGKDVLIIDIEVMIFRKYGGLVLVWCLFCDLVLLYAQIYD